MIDRLKRACLHSLTVGWSYLLAIVGGLLQAVDAAADALNDPSFKDSINEALGGNPIIVGRILLTVSVITIVARLRSLRKGA